MSAADEAIVSSTFAELAFFLVFAFALSATVLEDTANSALRDRDQARNDAGRYQTERDQAKNDASRYQTERDQAKNDASRYQTERDQARNDASRYQTERDQAKVAAGQHQRETDQARRAGRQYQGERDRAYGTIEAVAYDLLYPDFQFPLPPALPGTTTPGSVATPASPPPSPNLGAGQNGGNVSTASGPATGQQVNNVNFYGQLRHKIHPNELSCAYETHSKRALGSAQLNPASTIIPEAHQPAGHTGQVTRFTDPQHHPDARTLLHLTWRAPTDDFIVTLNVDPARLPADQGVIFVDEGARDHYLGTIVPVLRNALPNGKATLNAMEIQRLAKQIATPAPGSPAQQCRFAMLFQNGPAFENAKKRAYQTYTKTHLALEDIKDHALALLTPR